MLHSCRETGLFSSIHIVYCVCNCNACKMSDSSWETVTPAYFWIYCRPVRNMPSKSGELTIWKRCYLHIVYETTKLSHGPEVDRRSLARGKRDAGHDSNPRAFRHFRIAEVSAPSFHFRRKGQCVRILFRN